MDIVFIGSGNVVVVLGRKLVAAGHTILQIMSRNASEASSLAYEWDTESANYMSLINKNADVYIVAVADDAIEDVVKDLKLHPKIIVHTAGAVKMDVLKNSSENYGVFYPLQSLRKEQTELPETPIYLEASNEKTFKVLSRLAGSINHEQNFQANFDKRTKLHLAAVMVNNFTNHIFTLAEYYCLREGLDFQELLPLIENTYQRLKNEAPSKLQTGPAARGDLSTIEKHLELLKEYPQLKKLYEFFSESIKTMK